MTTETRAQRVEREFMAEMPPWAHDEQALLACRRTLVWQSADFADKIDALVRAVAAGVRAHPRKTVAYFVVAMAVAQIIGQVLVRIGWAS